MLSFYNLIANGQYSTFVILNKKLQMERTESIYRNENVLWLSLHAFVQEIKRLQMTLLFGIRYLGLGISLPIYVKPNDK